MANSAPTTAAPSESTTQVTLPETWRTIGTTFFANKGGVTIRPKFDYAFRGKFEEDILTDEDQCSLDQARVDYKVVLLVLYLQPDLQVSTKLNTFIANGLLQKSEDALKMDLVHVKFRLITCAKDLKIFKAVPATPTYSYCEVSHSGFPDHVLYTVINYLLWPVPPSACREGVCSYVISLKKEEILLPNSWKIMGAIFYELFSLRSLDVVKMLEEKGKKGFSWVVRFYPD
ncbi:hypothetical protein BXZ70DRAFT_911130 [Cristinia sonorae]|uniref:Uncharacterized protein n=1 Tax=Cristinia sonorae TaxID=1940300 RepID=A0A8K0UET5_9AGAR|nr:hypothetical protein BXZ70DRAFT_911130 [Cristinia sonorae]